MHHFAFMRRSRAAVLDMPFKLLLSTIIMAVTVAVAYQGLNTYARSHLENSVKAEAGRVADAASLLNSTMAAGSALKAVVKVQEVPFHHIERFRLGGPPGEPTSALITYRLSTGAEGQKVVRDAAGSLVRLTSRTNATFALDGGNGALLLTKESLPGIGTVIVVEAA